MVEIKGFPGTGDAGGTPGESPGAKDPTIGFGLLTNTLPTYHAATSGEAQDFVIAEVRR